MCLKFIFFQLIFYFFTLYVPGQVKVRIFAAKPLKFVLFTVKEGKYELDTYGEEPLVYSKGETVVFLYYNGRVAVKSKGTRSFACDSLTMKGLTGSDSFFIRVNSDSPTQQFYDGDLKCLADLGFLVLINNCDIEKYIAGVVQAEGGTGRNIEYIKTQALLARTYMYRYFERHLIDRYNLCDDTHCQVYMGNSTNHLINRAVNDTKGLVVLASDSSLIMSAFHSNCGGETESSENVWLSGQPYLKKVVDPYCSESRNARWTKSIPLSEWENYLKGYGYNPSADKSKLSFAQITRQKYYKTGSFSLPFTKIREDLNLKSSFFSVLYNGNSIVLKGRGYGHGVGLCQEGAMVMASKGFDYKQILKFYYSHVIILDYKNARK